MAEPIVQVRNLTKRFGDFTAVDGVSFDIRQGEILGLLGPNGAGKTTTIQMLLGLITPTAGEIRMFGLPFDRHREEILGRVNFSSTYVSMPQALTVEENLRVVGKLYGMDRITSTQGGRTVAEGTAEPIKAVYGEADLEDLFLKLARTKPRA